LGSEVCAVIEGTIAESRVSFGVGVRIIDGELYIATENSIGRFTGFE